VTAQAGRWPGWRMSAAKTAPRAPGMIPPNGSLNNMCYLYQSQCLPVTWQFLQSRD